MVFSSFTSLIIQTLCVEIKPKILNFTVQELFQESHYKFVIHLVSGEKHERLFFCFSKPLIHFHLSSKRKRFVNETLHPLNSFLGGCLLKDISAINQDRILQLTFLKDRQEIRLIAEFFSKHPNYYLVDKEGQILLSLHATRENFYVLPEAPESNFSSVDSLILNNDKIERLYEQLEKEYQFAQAKKSYLSKLSKQIRKLRNKIEQLTQALEKSLEWQAIQHQGELLKANLSQIKPKMTAIEVWDWLTDKNITLPLDPQKTILEQMKELFKSAKKKEKSIEPLQYQLNLAKKGLEKTLQSYQEGESLKTISEIPIENTILKKNEKCISKEKKSSIYKEYYSASGYKIWVGKTAKMNDELTFKIANGRDWWLHVHNSPGSHVIIRLGKREDPDSETLEDAKLLALYYSQVREAGSAEVLWTQRKFVSRIKKGKSGLVQISKHAKGWVKFDQDRFRKLKERKSELPE